MIWRRSRGRGFVRSTNWLGGRLLLFSSALFDHFAVLADGFIVLVHLVSHELDNEPVGVLVVAVEVVGKVLRVIIHPGHHLFMKYVFLELVWKETGVLEESEHCPS